jgi:flagellar protein FliS
MMTMRHDPRISSYQQSRVLGSSQDQIVVLLYEQLLLHLRRARLQMERRELEAKAESFEKAIDIVFELLSSLDMEAGGELASRLSALYGYFITEIGSIGRTLDLERHDRLIALVSSLHESWQRAENELRAGGSTAEGA